MLYLRNFICLFIEPVQAMPASHEPIPELEEASFSPEQLERIAMVASQIDWNEFPMPNVSVIALLLSFDFLFTLISSFIYFFQPDDLDRLMETGFSKWRCQKALLLNQFDPELALGMPSFILILIYKLIDWLCTHIDDPTIDDPISTLKLAQIIMEVSRHLNEGPGRSFLLFFFFLPQGKNFLHLLTLRTKPI